MLNILFWKNRKSILKIYMLSSRIFNESLKKNIGKSFIETIFTSKPPKNKRSVT